MGLTIHYTLATVQPPDDASGYWPHRSDATFRRNLDQMSDIIAAMGVAPKDAGVEATVMSRIFRYAQLERLEAGDVRQQDKRLKQVVATVSSIARIV